MSLSEKVRGAAKSAVPGVRRGALERYNDPLKTDAIAVRRGTWTPTYSMVCHCRTCQGVSGRTGDGVGECACG